MVLVSRELPVRRGKKIILASFVLFFSLWMISLATPSFAGDLGRYQVIVGAEDNAYLVDSSTGFVWILTHRTLATGREPVAIPYKFIGITPQSQGAFLQERAHSPEKDGK